MESDHVGKPNEQTADKNTTPTSQQQQQGPPIQWPPQSHPPQVCYPPAIGPPNAQFHGYNALPPGGRYGPYPCPYPPPGPYYGQGYIQSEHRHRFAGACRCFFLFLVLVVVILLLTKLIIWATLLPRFPVFHVENMHVTNFNTDANPFTARWETEIRIENPNTKLYLYVDGMEVFMNYNYKYDVGFTWINPMFLESKNKTSMQVVINTGESAHHAVPIWIAQDMGKDQKNGGVNFELKIKVWVTLKSGMWLWFRRSLTLNVECDDLKVNFGNSTREGTLEFIKDREDCYVST
ncbi:hypothetical protein J1N35_017624 [Gossypium stocksii]|uniref:Late embryogenesis abundant protein LEA-2 subgroup domain-containing protein n=1 Tax=Gossypium stocksii TaxID=47602 RepID=A0A9D4A482_9ROSI|nr:hypothetical protein J1N35_017624 [Gossypium stocksii]